MTDSRVESNLSQAHDLCRRVAPIDLSDVPLYILPSSRLTAKLGAARGCFGFTTGTLDMLLRDEIGDAWQGRGPCIVINDQMILSELGDQHLAADFCGIVLHELAHVLIRPELFTEWKDPVPEQLDAKVRQLANHLAIDREPTRPWDGHGLSFIRVCLHLAWRAKQCGHPVMAANLCAGPTYGLSSALTYQRLLGDEPAQLANQTLRQIREPYPDEFFNQYLDDLARWERDHNSSFSGTPQ